MNAVAATGTASQHSRVGIIADTPLIQHLLQEVVVGAGYDVAVNTDPDRLKPALMHNETIRVWVVELEKHDQWDDFVQSLLESTESPILFGDGVIPARTHEDYPRWQRRMQEKLQALAPATQPPAQAPIFDLDRLRATRPPPVYSLPESLQQAPKTELGPIWVLCASLGGPEAVKQFLDVLPAELPASFLYAQHIDAGCVDALQQSIGRHTRLSLVHADHGRQLENGHVYLVPVDNEIRFTDNHGIVWQNNAWSGPYGPSLDHLLSNVAAHFGARAHAIVFSGMGSDGAIGAADIRAAGGTVWVQAANSCVQSSMPDSVQEVGVADAQGTPVELAEKLLTWLAERMAQVA
ncbi:chemotaxis protein CheB [Saccharospirillum impatiens]|uniref:chemotaxis protein CheB n=1 Tax=Saccharospirillum impatiens TaxID=169438 RepID=UPI0003F4CC97|nr:chemotaxis protein CheB [Saccharospirillum impatiens]